MKPSTKRRGIYVNPQVMNALRNRNIISIRTMDRATQITKRMVGITYEVNNGKGWWAIKVNNTMVGYRVGQFIDTKKLGPTIHHTKKNLKKKRKLRK
jgi:ribosomal protein S19